MEWLGYPPVGYYKDLDISALPINHAWMTVNTTVDHIGIYSVKDDCFNCPFKLEKNPKANKPESWQVDTSVQMTWRILRTSRPDQYMANNNKKGWLCEMRPILNEYGVYDLNVGKCEARPVVAPVYTYFPLLLCSLVLLGVCMIYSFINYIRRRKRLQKEEIHEKVLQISEENDNKQHSLYVFRGILLALIIFASTGGGGYPIFNNAWGGLTFAECLFFMYVWSVGFFIPLVMEEAFEQRSKCAMIRDVFVRAFTLVFLGTVIDSTVDSHHASIPLWCPLQRLGLAYLFVATAYVLTVQKFEMKSKILICKVINNLISLMWCWIGAGFILAIMVIAISTFQSFNCLGNIGLEDQRADYSNIKTEVTQNCNNNFTEYANQIFVGLSLKMVNVNSYFGFRAGALGIISTVMYMMIGLNSGVVYLQNKVHMDRFKLWIFWAILFALGGVCFAVVSYPMDFNLWPISSILLISAASMFVFSFIHLISEVRNYTSPILSAAGVTSLVLLSGHLLFSKSLPFNFQIHFDNHLLYLLQNFWIVALWLVNGMILFRRKVRFDM